MNTDSIKAVASSVEEAELNALKMMPEGNEPTTTEVQSDGRPASVSASAEDPDESVRKAQSKLPTSGPEPRITNVKTEVTSRETKTFHSFREDFSTRAETLDADGSFGDLHIEAIRSEVKWRFLVLTRYVHSVELIGDYQTDISYEREAAVTVKSRPFDAPAEMNSAFANPFSVLGLHNDARSAKSIAQRAGDITPLVEMKLDPAAYLEDFVSYPLFSSDASYSIKDVAAAKAQLISDIDRLDAARFWFSDLSSEERARLAGAADFGQAMHAVDTASGLSSEEKAYASALVSWYQCVAGEMQSTGSRLMYALPRWRETLEKWCNLYDNGTIVARTTVRAKVLSHPKIDAEYLTAQADQMMIDVCRPVIRIAVYARDQGFFRLADSYVGLINDLPLRLELRARILDEYFGKWLQTVRATLESLAEVEPLDPDRVNDVNAICNRISDSGGADICEIALGKQFDELLLIIRTKTKHAMSLFGSADISYFQESSHYVGLWNDATDVDLFRAVAQLIGVHWQNITTLRTARDDSLRQLENIRAVIGDASALTPAFADHAARLRESGNEVSENIRSVNREYDRTEGHIRRNASAMCEQLGISVNRPPAESRPVSSEPAPVPEGDFADLEARANAGDKEALRTLAEFYRTGRYVFGVFIPQDKEKAAQLAARAAELD